MICKFLHESQRIYIIVELLLFVVVGCFLKYVLFLWRNECTGF